jgi:hypothetical protein
VRKQCMQVVHSDVSVVIDEHKPDMEHHRKRQMVQAHTPVKGVG